MNNYLFHLSIYAQIVSAFLILVVIFIMITNYSETKFTMYEILMLLINFGILVGNHSIIYYNLEQYKSNQKLNFSI